MPTITSTSGQHTLVFDEDEHLYYLDGALVPGATEVKKGYPISANLTQYMIKQGIEEYKTGAKLKKVAAIGTFMHDYTFAKRMNKPFDDSKVVGHKDEEKIRKRFAEVDKWVETRRDEKIIMAEEIIGSPRYRFAGKFDCLVERNGKKVLQDYKSAKGFFVDQFIQLGGYRQALWEWFLIDVTEFEIIRFNDNTPEPASMVISDTAALNEFTEQFIRCRQTRTFQHKWETHFDKIYRAQQGFYK